MPLEVPPTQKADGEEEQDSFQQVFSDISKAQGKLDDSTNLNGLRKHLRREVYPLMGRVLGLTVDMRDAFRELALEVESQSGGIPAEDAKFITGYLDAISNFILKYAPVARAQAEQGDATLQQELGALHQGASAVREVVNSLTEDEVIVEEVPS